ncbi:hypothetical protein HYX17_01445 [Candidatus Woesearchaeota archaeon]|nr:hypothetical protein [Candidatus Woesearchaeota archaeon]
MLESLLSYSKLERLYISTGIEVANAFKYLELYFNLGEEKSIHGFEKLIKKWGRLEREYVRRGFKTISFDAFVNYAENKKLLDTMMERKYAEDENPIFYAEHFREIVERLTMEWAFVEAQS